MPTFTSVCRCCGEERYSDQLDDVWDHFIDHSDAGHDATFHRTARTGVPERATARPAVEQMGD